MYRHMLFKVPPPLTFFITRFAYVAIAFFSKAFVFIIARLKMLIKSVGSGERASAEWTGTFLAELFFKVCNLVSQGFVLLF